MGPGVSAKGAGVAASDYLDSREIHVSLSADIDPLARLLRALRIIGKRPPQSLILPVSYFIVYFLLNDIVLPTALGRFSTTHDYIGPFDPKLLANRITDGVFVPILVYYYGQVSQLFQSLFDRLHQNGVFGPPQPDDSDKIRYHRTLYNRWVRSVWLFPLVIMATLIIGVRSAFDYMSPPHAHTFINSDLSVFVFNQALWILNYYFIAVIAMRYVLFTAWLLQLQRKQAIERIAPDVLHLDGRMGFSPITECVVTAAKIFTVALLILVFVIRGNENIGLAPSSPDWLGYLVILVVSLPFVVLPIYLVHRIMLQQKDEYTSTFEGEASYSHSSWLLLEWQSTRGDARERWQAAQLLFLRLSQVKDWPVTLEEASTIFFTYLLGTVFTILSTLQSIIGFLR